MIVAFSCQIGNRPFGHALVLQDRDHRLANGVKNVPIIEAHSLFQVGEAFTDAVAASAIPILREPRQDVPIFALVEQPGHRLRERGVYRNLVPPAPGRNSRLPWDAPNPQRSP